MSNNLLSESVSAPLDGASVARIDIQTAGGNVTIDDLADGQTLLATATLEYFEQEGAPDWFVTSERGHAALHVRGSEAGHHPWFRLPWSACNGATEWQIHLNPNVASEISARTGGGNLKLGLGMMAVTHVTADSGGGNLEVELPEHAANLHVTARTGAGNVAVEIGCDITGASTVDATSGAGNVVVRVPRGIAARVHATTGLGKVIVDPSFGKMDRQTFQSADYDAAADKLEISVHSGAGNVCINTSERVDRSVRNLKGSNADD